MVDRSDDSGNGGIALRTRMSAADRAIYVAMGADTVTGAVIRRPPD
jgi:hypothetical protein